MAQHELHPHAPRCTRCGDVIGVYEPAVLVVDGMARDTSLAAEEPPVPAGGTWHHRDCFVAATVAA